MFGKTRFWAVAVLAAILSLVGANGAFAYAPSGAGPDSAMAPAAGLVQIAPGAQQWYAFHSDAAASDATDKKITALLTAYPQGSVSFNVWTPAGYREWAAGLTNDNGKLIGGPIGAGTLHQAKDGDTTYDRFGGSLEWNGTSNQAGTYYIQVQSNSQMPSSYTLSISGDYVSFPSANQTVAAQPVAAKQAVAMKAGSSGANAAPLVLPATGNAAQPKAALGSAPDNALTLSGQTEQLPVGAQQWYAFQYPGPAADGTQPVASLLLNAYPQGSASFYVWSPQGLRNLALGLTNDSGKLTGVPVGAGTLHQAKDGDNTYDRFGGSLEWNGAFGSAGTYYVQVVQNGGTPSSYSLQFSQQ